MTLVFACIDSKFMYLSLEIKYTYYLIYGIGQVYIHRLRCQKLNALIQFYLNLERSECILLHKNRNKISKDKIKFIVYSSRTYFSFIFTSEFWFEQFQQNPSIMKTFMSAFLLLAFIAEINAGKVYRPIKIRHTLRRIYGD